MVAFQLKALRWGRVSRCGHYAAPENTARKKDDCGQVSAGSCNIAQNDARTLPDDSHKIRTGCSENVHASEPPETKESPGALAGATGAKEQSVEDLANHTARWAIDASHIVSAVYACAPANRLPLIEATFDHLCAGTPNFAADHDAMDWARRWAEIASLRERKAYALACFEAMPERDQQAFLAYVSGRAAA